jgi:hypothetical protein
VEIEFDALLHAVAFLRTPHILDVMTSLDRGQQPHRVLSDVDPELIDAAVRLLLDAGAAHRAVGGVSLGPDSPGYCVALTPKGREVLGLASELDCMASSAGLAKDDCQPS